MTWASSYPQLLFILNVPGIKYFEYVVVWCFSQMLPVYFVFLLSILGSIEYFSYCEYWEYEQYWRPEYCEYWEYHQYRRPEYCEHWEYEQ